MAEAERLKEAGNECFRRKVYREASALYQQALNVAPTDSTSRAVYYGNKAACSMRLSEFNDALQSCNEALKINNEYVKVLMRRCLVYEQLRQWENAMSDALRVLEIDPSHEVAKKSLQRLQKKGEILGQQLKELGSNVFEELGVSLEDFNAEENLKSVPRPLPRTFEK